MLFFNNNTCLAVVKLRGSNRDADANVLLYGARAFCFLEAGPPWYTMQILRRPDQGDQAKPTRWRAAVHAALRCIST